MKLDKKWLLALAFLSTPAICVQAQNNLKDWQHQSGAKAIAAREQWQKITQGEDLARGKQLTFTPAPNYRLTTDGNDAHDLTDGTLSGREDDRIWFTSDAVGWYQLAATGGVLMVVDLGSVQPVGQIAIRLLGGHEQGSLDLPSSVEFLASSDGRQFYRLQKQVKLAEGEKALANQGTGYYFAETGTAFVVPVVSREAVQARYIGIRVQPVNSVFTDQISVLKAKPNTAFKNLESYPKARVLRDGLAVTPRQETLTVTQNIVTPNWFSPLDNSGLDPAKEKLGFRIELPQGLRASAGPELEFKEVAASTPATTAYEASYKKTTHDGSLGPLWIEKDPAANIPATATVRITGLIQGKESHSLQFPVRIVSIPETAPSKALDVSLAWMDDGVQQKWPNFLRDFRKMGFNTVSTFPRYFGKAAAGNWNAAAQKNLDFLRQARADGYTILYNESPFHEMWKVVQADLKAGKINDAEAEQLFAQVDGARSERMNILYRGQYFQNEMKRVAELTALTQPDQIFLDIEWWTEHVAASRKDPRVLAAWQQSGKTWEEFVTDIGTEVLTTLVTGIRAATPEKKLLIGLYDSAPSYNVYNTVFQFDKIYPGIIDLAQPSLYVQGRAQLVAERVRFDHDTLKNREIIPWLTAGTYGEFDSPLLETVVLEAVLNGSRGLTYFWFGDFDPMDFYYHSKALVSLAPFEKLLQNGKPVTYKGDNPNLHYTAFASGDEALVLVGNYGNSPQGKVNLPLPFAAAKKAQHDGKALAIKGNSVALDVPPGEFRLISFSNE